MQIMICDDDAASRLVMHRKLSQTFTCTVVECRDGAEALRQLETTPFDLVVLDVEMPVIDGIAVLESIRRSPKLSHLAVMMASKERRADVVDRLIQLGITAYLLKPLSPHALTEAFGKLKAKLRAGGGYGPGRPLGRLSAERPALLVDGDAHYRRFFVSQAERHGAVVAADSASAGLAMFQKAPASVVFVGSRLGQSGAETLIQKLRLENPNQPPQIVGICDGRARRELQDGCDDVMRRTLVAGLHQAELQRFIEAPGALVGVSQLIGDVSEIVIADALQLIALMCDAEVACAEVESGQLESSTAVTIQLGDRWLVSLGVHLTEASAKAVAARPQKADATSLATLLAARLQSAARQRDVHCQCGDAGTVRQPGAELPAISEDAGFAIAVDCAEIGARVHITLEVAERPQP